MPTTRAEIQDLLEAARDKKPEALDRLLSEYRQYLTILARGWTGKRLQQKSDASDLVQQTLLNAFANFASFRGNSEAELIAWLRRILANNLAQLVRRFQTDARKITRDRSLEEMVAHSSQAVGDILAASGVTPSRIVSQREQGVVLAETLAKLSADQREVVMLRNFEQLGWPEIAARMDRSPGAAKMLWVRALQNLKKMIEE